MKRSFYYSLIAAVIMAVVTMPLLGCGMTWNPVTGVQVDGRYTDQGFVLLYNTGAKRHIYQFTITEHINNSSWEAGNYVLDPDRALDVTLEYGHTYSILVRQTDFNGQPGRVEASSGRFTIAGEPTQRDQRGFWYHRIVKVD